MVNKFKKFYLNESSQYKNRIERLGKDNAGSRINESFSFEENNASSVSSYKEISENAKDILSILQKFASSHKYGSSINWDKMKDSFNKFKTLESLWSGLVDVTSQIQEAIDDQNPSDGYGEFGFFGTYDPGTETREFPYAMSCLKEASFEILESSSLSEEEARKIVLSYLADLKPFEVPQEMVSESEGSKSPDHSEVLKKASELGSFYIGLGQEAERIASENPQGIGAFSHFVENQIQPKLDLVESIISMDPTSISEDLAQDTTVKEYQRRYGYEIKTLRDKEIVDTMLKLESISKETISAGSEFEKIQRSLGINPHGDTSSKIEIAKSIKESVISGIKSHSAISSRSKSSTGDLLPKEAYIKSRNSDFMTETPKVESPKIEEKVSLKKGTSFADLAKKIQNIL